MRELEASTRPKLRASQTGLNDILAQVLGPEKQGRVRALGFRATSTNTFRSSSSKTTPESQNEVISLRQKVNSIESKMKAMQKYMQLQIQQQQ